MFYNYCADYINSLDLHIGDPSPNRTGRPQPPTAHPFPQRHFANWWESGCIIVSWRNENRDLAMHRPTKMERAAQPPRCLTTGQIQPWSCPS